MIKAKLSSIVLIIVIIITLFSNRTTYEYEFMQPVENITSIEFVYADPYRIGVDHSKLEAEYVIDKDLWPAFIDDFTAIPCKRSGLDPSQSLSGNVIRISYKDGCCEVFSAFSSKQFDTTGKGRFTIYHFDKDAFESLVQKYYNTGDGLRRTKGDRGTVLLSPSPGTLWVWWEIPLPSPSRQLTAPLPTAGK